MPKANLPGGKLISLTQCYIKVPAFGEIKMKVLPDISDSKSASYNDEPIIGRSSPLKTYSHSENRVISWTIHFVAVAEEDLNENIRALRALESAVYPRTQNTSGAPYAPPPICKIKCGKLLTETEDLCVILRNYDVKFPTDTVWHTVGSDSGYIPFKFDVSTSWEVVYESSDLPGSERILTEGR